MANSREILLKLVRLSMGWESDCSLPENVDWKEVLEIASKQGVEAIVLDGYDVYLSKNPGVVSVLKKPEIKPFLLAAIGRMNKTELNNLQHLVALVELSKILQNEGITFLVMKGFSCGQYYPNPRHRLCGDVDIYAGDYFVESNLALKSFGIDVDPYYYRHSASTIKGVMIENHKFLCDLRGPKRQTRALEAQLEDEGKKSIAKGNDVVVDGNVVTGAKYPIANFNALFLPWHVSAHFEFEYVTIRHLLDWALFLVNDGKNIDVEMFREAKKKYTYGIGKFADILTNLSIRYLHIPTDRVPAEIVTDAKSFNNALADRVFEYMFVGQPRKRDKRLWLERLNNLKRIWEERWKYKEIYGMSAANFLCNKIRGVLLKEGE